MSVIFGEKIVAKIDYDVKTMPNANKILIEMLNDESIDDKTRIKYALKALEELMKPKFIFIDNSKVR